MLVSIEVEELHIREEIEGEDEPPLLPDGTAGLGVIDPLER